MGNTVTKESGAGSGSFNAIGSNTTGDLPRNSQRRSGTSGDQQSSSHHSSHRRTNRHHGHSGSSRSKREGYEMIKDPNETVDGGLLFPLGVYQGGQDFKVSVVREMIIKRKMAPFYRGLDSVEPNCTDDELLEAVDFKEPENEPKEGQPGPPTNTQLIWLYRHVHECPICFLDYPRLNSTRCCAQDICTECFVQIKRNPPHPPYTSDTEATDVLDLLSEPAACPYCAQPDLGIIFEAPPFEWGMPSSKVGSAAPILTASKRDEEQSKSAISTSASQDLPLATKNPFRASVPTTIVSDSSRTSPGDTGGSGPKTQISRKRRSSVPANHDSVVTVDMIRPDWEEKLASARRRLARKSAAARALHEAALIPNGGSSRPPSSRSSGVSNPGQESPRTSRRAHDPAISNLIRATRHMSVEQTRALEQKMIEDAINASLAQR